MKYVILWIVLGTAFIPALHSEEDEARETEKIQSITEERRDIIRYGIDSQVIDVLGKLEDEKNDALVEESSEIFRNTLNTKIKLAVLSYFEAVDYTGTVKSVLEYLENYEEDELPADVIAASIRYTADKEESDTRASRGLFMELCGHNDELVARAAIEALGHCDKKECVDYLLDLYEDDDTTDNRRGFILSSLGTMGVEKALPMIEEVLDDPDEEKSLRWKACQALGDIGAPQSLPAIRRALGSEDTYLRSYATAALKAFEGKEVEDLLMQALKDSFWRVRISAAETLGERKAQSAVSILLFKAEKDPEQNVKMAALKALAAIGTAEAMEYIRAVFEKKISSPPFRVEAARILIEQDLDSSIDGIEKVLADSWEDRNASFRNAVGNYLSLQEHKDLKSLFEKMLGHPDIPMRLYGLRGIARNKFTSLKPKLEELSGQGNPSTIRKEALAALEEM